MAKYIKCYHCYKKIPFGEFICLDSDEMPYCSPKCLVDSYGGELKLTDEQAEYWGFEVFDDDERRRKIEKEIAKLQRELKTLTIQN